MPPTAAARSNPPAMFLRARARVGCRRRRTSGSRPSSAPGPAAVGQLWARVERVVDRRGGDAVSGQLAPAQLVDGHMGPRRVVGWWGHVRQVGSLPGEIVVMQHGRSPGAHGGGESRRGRVERERAQILDDDEIGRGESVDKLLVCGRRRGVDGQTLESDVDGARTRDRENVPAQMPQRTGPFRRFDRDAVVAAQPE